MPFSRLRVAMLSYRLPAAGEKRGGIERSAHTLAQGLAERGHRVVVFSHDDVPADASYEVRPLPWKGFVDTWVGTRVTMGYLGNLLALVPGYRDFDVVVAHGDSLLLPLTGKPVLRVMHGSGWGEAQSARTWGRRFLQYGVYAQELLTAATQRGVVAVSENTRHDNRFVSHVIPHGVDSRVFHAVPGSKTAHPSVLFVGALDGRKRGQFLVHAFLDVIRPAHPTATLTVVGPEGPDVPRRDLSHRRLRRRARRAVSAGVGVRLAQHLRGLRSAVSGGDGVRHGGCRHGESRQPRGAGERRVRIDARRHDVRCRRRARACRTSRSA